jgi:outer membrane protein TolC
MPVHPALQVQGAKIEIARQNYEFIRAAMLPTVNLQTSYGAGQDLDHFTGGQFHSRPTLFLAVLQVNVPLLDFGQRQAATKQAVNQVGSARAALSQAALDLRTAITNAYNSLHTIDSNIASLQLGYVSAESTARQTRARRKLEMADELALVDSEYALLNARELLGAARLQLWLQLATLQNVSGGVWHWQQ